MAPGLYVHVPFCVRKCVYCDFYSVETRTRSGQPTDANLGQDRFLEALELEFQRLPTPFAPATIFIGGGTPTELSGPNLQRLFELIHAYIDVDHVTEWTCEINPGTLTEAKAKRVRKSGVNRVSLGAQSFDAQNLKFLGRIHGPDDIASAFQLLRDTGFDNINLDLIYGIPQASLESVARDIDQICALDPEHVSCYCLTFEEGTPLMGMKRRGEVTETDDDSELAQYKVIRQTLEQAGFEQYELSNFSKPSRRCAHNILYWTGGEYLGCGPAAHSHWQGIRKANHRRLSPWSQDLLAGKAPLQFEERLEPEAKAREILVNWLRLIDGVPRSGFKQVTGYDWKDLVGTEIEKLDRLGVLVQGPNTLRLSESGLFVSDRVFAELI